MTKVLTYKAPVHPTGADNFQYSTYYYNGRKAYNMKGFVLGDAAYDIVDLRFNPAGSAYAVLSRRKDKDAVEIFDAWQQKEVLHRLRDCAGATALCYSADSRRLYVATATGRLLVYETRQYGRTDEWQLPLAAERLTASPNGYFLAARQDNRVAVVNQETGTTRTTLTLPARVTDVAFTDASDQMGVLTADGRLTVYDTRAFQPAAEFGQLGQALALAFHPEGKYATVLTAPDEVAFQNLLDPADRPTLRDEDGGGSYVRYLRDGRRNTYLSYNTRQAVRYKVLRGFLPNLTRMLMDELNARMNEWARMMPGETMEEYQARVNEESRLRQMRLFEQEITTELASGLIMQAEVSLGGYNPDTGVLTLELSNMPQIFLTVPQDELASFANPQDLEFRDVVYGLTPDERFEVTYATVYNRATGKSYVFNNLERRSLDFLNDTDNFVPIELVQQSSMEDFRLQGIKDDIVGRAMRDQLISDHTHIAVNATVVPAFDAEGRRINNYQVGFSYTVEGSYSVREDFPAGRYRTDDSHAAASMLDIVSQAFAQDFAQYLQPGRKLVVSITGSADALKINGTIPYDGCYGDFTDEPYHLDGALNAMTVTRQTGIRQNEQLAFLRAVGVRDHISRHVPALADMQTDYQYHIQLSEGVGGEFRRISVEFTFVDAFPAAQ